MREEVTRHAEHPLIDPEKVKVILATDCGSTTTKAILIEKKGDEFRQTFRGEAPTTVEAPFEDVTRGVLNSFQEVEELSGRKLLDGETIIMPANDKEGVDIYVSTSSAGGGLQMMVAGAVLSMTAESAQRAALGAGAIVMDVLASNDGRLPHRKLERIRHLRPDMILLSGGTDGGTVHHVVELAELISAADPRPRLGITYRLPVIYAGNKDARDQVSQAIGDKTALVITDNLRPILERENLFPARQKIQDLFEEHVMAQAPGYNKLMDWVSASIMPTPAAVGLLIRTIAEERLLNVIGVDIGGATTDIFSDFNVSGQRVFNRSVSANLGMSYSVSNVLAEAGLDNIFRWIHFPVEPEEVRNRVKNKMVRPTTIPQTLEELIIEHALAREALRLSFIQHKSLAVGLKGIQQERSISDTFSQTATGETFISMMDLDMLVGSGGVLSHAPRRSQSMLLLMDAFQPEGFTTLTVDSIFMMPHLGVLSIVHKQAAVEVFEKDCLIFLGTCVAPKGRGKLGEPCIKYSVRLQSGQVIEDNLPFGKIKLYPLGVGESAEITATPTRNFDLGKGKGKTVTRDIVGGVVGLVIDTRGRPIELPTQKEKRDALLEEWLKMMNAYPL